MEAGHLRLQGLQSAAMMAIMSRFAAIRHGIYSKTPVSDKPNKSRAIKQNGIAYVEDDSEMRYQPSAILKRHRIKHVLWFEDVLVHYGSDTSVFELYILVSNPRKAGSVLKRFGYHESPFPNLFENDDCACRGGIRLASRYQSSKYATVLISASEWRYNLDLKVTVGDASLPLPPLHAFLECLMDKWMSIPEETFKDLLLWAFSLVNLIDCCYDLSGPNALVVRDAKFAELLRPEFREIHYDIVTYYPGKCGISCFQKRKYHRLRAEQIKQGTFVARPYPSTIYPMSLAEYPHLTGMNTDIATNPAFGRKKKLSQIAEDVS